MTEPDDTVALEREDASELAESIRSLGSWLYQAPGHIRRDFARHAFRDPTAPGANTQEFLDALHHAWQHLEEALAEKPAQGGHSPR